MMERINILGLVLSIVLILSFNVFSFSSSPLEENYQDEMDKIRMGHVNQISDVIYDYYKVTGRYPLQEEVTNKPITVFVTKKEIKETFIEQAKKNNYKLVKFDKFKAEVEKVLGEKITFPEDPQSVPTFAGNFYIYYVDKMSSSITGNLYSENDWTYDAGNYYKYEKAFFNSPSSIDYSEIYLNYNIGGRYVYLKHYDVKGYHENKNAISSIVKDVTEKFKEGRFINEEYGLENMRLRKERLFKDRSIVTAEYHLTTETDEVIVVLRELLEKILRQNVFIDYNSETKKLNIFYDQRDIYIADNNFDGVYGSKDSSQRMIVWDTKLNNFEAVFTIKNNKSISTSFYEYLEEDVSSPEFD